MTAQMPSRKQWRLFRGPKGNIQSLGWAEFGCPESQVKLAKELLEESGEECIDKEEKCRLGVYWLLKASEKGHEEATRMLQECLDNGTGITEHNLSDVRSCLAMPKEEKLSREAAKELFLSLSQGENYITSNQLFRETLKYSEGPIPVEADMSHEWILYDQGNVERLTEDMVISAGSQHLQGDLPLVLNRPIMKSSPLAIGTIQLARLIPVLRPVYIILFIALLGIEFIIDAAPLLIYYTSFILMILASSQILSKKWEFTQFQRWSYALVACGCSEEVSAQAQWNHCTQNSSPFFIFILSLVIHLISLPYVPVPPYSEITTLSTLISIYMLYNLMWRNKRLDFAVLVTFTIHLVARYPYEVDSLVYHYWRYLDVHVPTLTSLVVGSSIEFCLNFRVLLYLLLPGIFLTIARRDRWLGTFKTLLPLLVCLSWWQIAVFASNGATSYGLIRSCLGLVLFVLFLPLSSITFLFVPFLTVAKFFIAEQISVALATAGATLTFVVYIGMKCKKRSKIFPFLQIIMCVLSLYFIMNGSGIETVDKTYLSWKDVTEVCAEESIPYQERCSAFIGEPVSWEGQVTSTKLSAVYNSLEHILNYLPETLQKFTECFLGEDHKDCRNQDCSNSVKKCRISNWNRYEYEIEVELNGDSWRKGSTTVWLKGGQAFRNFTKSLKKDDKIWFSGFILGLKFRQPYISLVRAKCLTCILPDQRVLEVHPLPLTHLFDKLFPFIFYPIGILR